MTATQIALFNRLKWLGFRPGNQMKLYGETFEFLSKPIVMTDNVVLLDAIEKDWSDETSPDTVTNCEYG